MPSSRPYARQLHPADAEPRDYKPAEWALVPVQAPVQAPCWYRRWWRHRPRPGPQLLSWLWHGCAWAVAGLLVLSILTSLRDGLATPDPRPSCRITTTPAAATPGIPRRPAVIPPPIAKPMDGPAELCACCADDAAPWAGQPCSAWGVLGLPPPPPNQDPHGGTYGSYYADDAVEAALQRRRAMPAVSYHVQRRGCVNRAAALLWADAPV